MSQAVNSRLLLQLDTQAHTQLAPLNYYKVITQTEESKQVGRPVPGREIAWECPIAWEGPQPPGSRTQENTHAVVDVPPSTYRARWRRLCAVPPAPGRSRPRTVAPRPARESPWGPGRASACRGSSGRPRQRAENLQPCPSGVVWCRAHSRGPHSCWDPQHTVPGPAQAREPHSGTGRGAAGACPHHALSARLPALLVLEHPTWTRRSLNRPLLTFPPPESRRRAPPTSGAPHCRKTEVWRLAGAGARKVSVERRPWDRGAVLCVHKHEGLLETTAGSGWPWRTTEEAATGHWGYGAR